MNASVTVGNIPAFFVENVVRFALMFVSFFVVIGHFKFSSVRSFMMCWHVRKLLN